jgi:hypothetical protein
VVDPKAKGTLRLRVDPAHVRNVRVGTDVRAPNVTLSVNSGEFAYAIVEVYLQAIDPAGRVVWESARITGEEPLAWAYDKKAVAAKFPDAAVKAKEKVLGEMEKQFSAFSQQGVLVPMLAYDADGKPLGFPCQHGLGVDGIIESPMESARY